MMDLQFNKNEDTNKLRLSEINQLYAKIKKGGGEKALQKQHEQGKLTARERIAYLLDNDDEAIEIAAFAGHEMYEEHGGCPSAGVVVKIGKISGKQCIVVASTRFLSSQFAAERSTARLVPICQLCA